MEELLKINVPFIWNKECTKSSKTLKKRLIEAPILRFHDWSKNFHVHIDKSAIVVDAILTQLGDYNMDHPNAYASRNLNKAEKNYVTTEREGLGMIFSLQKFHHYLLANPFIFYTDH